MSIIRDDSEPLVAEPGLPAQARGPQLMPPPQGSLNSPQSLREKLSDLSRTYSTHLKIISEHIGPLAAAREELVKIEHEMSEQVKSLQTIQRDSSEIRATMSRTLQEILGAIQGPDRKEPESETAMPRSKQDYA
jgi:hypothetical protein